MTKERAFSVQPDRSPREHEQMCRFRISKTLTYMNNRRRCFLKVVAAVWLFIVPAFGQSQPAADGAQQFAALGAFQLQSGEVIHDFRLGYRTLVQLTSGRSQARLVATGLGSSTPL